MYGYRDIVRVIDDIAEAHSLQTADHGGWNDDIALVSKEREGGALNRKEGVSPLLIKEEKR